MSRVFITSDTHGHLEIGRLNSDNFPIGKELTKDDYVIICGDFGLIFYQTETLKEKYWLNWLEDKPWTTLFVDGNHENFARLNAYPVEEWHGGKVHKIRPSIIHLMRGQVFDINGYKWFTYGGAESTDRQWRIPYKTWWPEETPSLEEYNEGVRNLRAVDFKVDYIITHAMPQSYLEFFFYRVYTKPNHTPYQLQDFESMCEYRKWYCGHYHMDVDLDEAFHILYHRIIEVDFDKEE